MNAPYRDLGQTAGGPAKPLLVYVSGPLSKDPLGGTRNACAVADALLRHPGITPVVPHLGITWQLVAPKSYEEWMRYDLALLGHCGALIRLPGESPGSDREVQRARELGIPVFWSAESLVTWAAGRT